jgi:hypothetical protein
MDFCVSPVTVLRSEDGIKMATFGLEMVLIQMIKKTARFLMSIWLRLASLAGEAILPSSAPLYYMAKFGR